MLGTLVTLLLVVGLLVVRGAAKDPAATASVRTATATGGTDGRAAVVSTHTPPAAPAVGPAAGVPAAVSRAVAAQSAAGIGLSVAVYDATDGRTWTFQDRPGQIEASVSKLAILGATLRAEQAGAARTRRVAAEEASMIGASDNKAAEELYGRVGRAGLDAYADAVGATDVDPGEDSQFGLDTSTALDQVKVMKGFAYANRVLTTGSRAQAAALLASVEADQRWGATAGVPHGVGVLVKDGWLPHGAGWVVNTVGHVTGAGRDYVVAILSQGSATEQDGIARLAAVSSAVWATAGHAG